MKKSHIEREGRVTGLADSVSDCRMRLVVVAERNDPLYRMDHQRLDSEPPSSPIDFHLLNNEQLIKLKKGLLHALSYMN